MPNFWRDNINPDDTLHKVVLERDTLLDSERDDRPVRIKVYAPSDIEDAKVPIIVWSHGLGGSVDGAAFLSRFIASHGYILYHVQHHGTDSSLWEGKPGHPWDIIRQLKIPRSATMDRFYDVPFALDRLPNWLKSYPDIEGIADLGTVGMSGHSFGSLSTQVMGGMMFPDKEGKLRRLRDDRFKAGILYSPGPIDHLGLDDPADVYGSIDMPMLHMTGTDDSSPVENWDYTKRLDVYNNITEAKQHLLVIKDGDHMVFNGSRGKLGQNPNREKHERIIKICALAYWDATLKEDKAAKDWLDGEGIQNWLNQEATFE